MSICRFSSANWACDVYCYEAIGGGYAIKVAKNRIAADIPKLPRIGSVGSQAYLDAYREQREVIHNAPREMIGGPHDGGSFHAPDEQSCIQTLRMLRSEGYRVPAFVFALLEEIPEDD